MCTYYIEKINNLTDIPQSVEKDFDKYLKQVKRFYYFEEKHAKKIEPFSENDDLVEYLLSLVEDLPPLLQSGNEFWYLLTTFAYSKYPKAIKYLEDLTDLYIEKKSPANSFLLHIFSFTENSLLKSSLEKERKYFEKLYEESDYFKFVEQVGIDISGYNFQKIGREGYFSFTITTIPNKEYDFECKTDEEKKQFYSLNISIFTPKGTEKCYTFKLSSVNNDIYLCDADKNYTCYNERYVTIKSKEKGKEKIIKNGEKILQLKNTIREIEKFIGIKFSREKIYFSFERGVKGKKNLEKWLRED